MSFDLDKCVVVENTSVRDALKKVDRKSLWVCFSKMRMAELLVLRRMEIFGEVLLMGLLLMTIY